MAQAELQACLAFLTKDAKVPLATALPKYKLLLAHGLTTPDTIARSDTQTLAPIFEDDKIVKQVLGAAKRLSNPKKRKNTDPDASSSLGNASKQPKLTQTADREAKLHLPQIDCSIEDLLSVVIETNRAPLFLAFAFIVSCYTLSDQPLSSRLSLAQAVTSAGAQSKAKWIGLTDSTAEDEGWAEGQPKVKLMGREIAVMRRHIEILDENKANDSQRTVDAPVASSSHTAFWGIDIEALRKANGKPTTHSVPPIHTPEAARAYLLRSIDLAEYEKDVSGDQTIKIEDEPSSSKPKKLTPAQRTARKEEAVAMLLKSLNHLCASWAAVLTGEDLDRRASTWYMKVRPDVAGGQAGWGQRGKVPLKAILDLARDTETKSEL